MEGDYFSTITHHYNESKVYTVKIKYQYKTEDLLFEKTVRVREPPSALPVDTLFICPGDSQQVDARNDGAEYLWSGGGTIRLNWLKNSGVHWVRIREPYCAIIDTIHVVHFPIAPIELDSLVQICDGKEKRVSIHSSHDAILWPDGSSDTFFNASEPGRHIMHAWNNGCISTKTFYGEIVYGSTHMSMDTICKEEQVLLDLPRGSEFVWTDSLQAAPEQRMVRQEGVYELQYLNELGCNSDYSYHIIRYCGPSLYMPNSFSPNGDGINDVFLPSYNGYDSVRLRVFSRWGAVVFDGKIDHETGWDGTYKGEIVPAGRYMFVLYYSYKKGRRKHEERLQGAVHVIK